MYIYIYIYMYNEISVEIEFARKQEILLTEATGILKFVIRIFVNIHICMCIYI
jgi:hypothetical protein